MFKFSIRLSLVIAFLLVASSVVSAQQTCPAGTKPITSAGAITINNQKSYGFCINLATGAITVNGSSGGGATIAHTINVISGDNAGNGVDSGLVTAKVLQNTDAFSQTALQAQFGSFGLQSYDVNNSFVFSNLFFDGSNYRYVGTGNATYLFLAAGEIQMRALQPGTAGAIATSLVQLKATNDGTVSIGGNISTTPGNYTGAALIAGQTIGGGVIFVQHMPTASDSGCTTTANVGKIWFDNTTTTTALKVCVNKAGTVSWSSLILP